MLTWFSEFFLLEPDVIQRKERCAKWTGTKFQCDNLLISQNASIIAFDFLKTCTWPSQCASVNLLDLRQIPVTPMLKVKSVTSLKQLRISKMFLAYQKDASSQSFSTGSNIISFAPFVWITLCNEQLIDSPIWRQFQQQIPYWKRTTEFSFPGYLIFRQALLWHKNRTHFWKLLPCIDDIIYLQGILIRQVSCAPFRLCISNACAWHAKCHSHSTLSGCSCSLFPMFSIFLSFLGLFSARNLCPLHSTFSV